MSKTLLLADDSVVIQKLVGLSFASEDVEIVSTDNGDDAVTKARELCPDVVLADVVMPGKSGYEVCEAIKRDPALAHIPVLLLTGTFEAFDEARAQAVGATGHITKPFEAQALVERVKTVVKNAGKPAPRPSAVADDLSDQSDRILPPPARASFFGDVESLDVTPSLSEEDLSESLDLDLFGPPGNLGGATPGGETLFGESVAATASTDSHRFADAPIEDATVAMISEPIEPRTTALDGPDSFGTDLGVDDLLEVSPLPPSAFDLDSAFDPEPQPVASPPSRSPALSFARDDANAATSRSFDGPGVVADLDEMLAMPTPAPTPQPIGRIELRPEAPTIVDLGPAEQSGSDLDFGFDVSEQLAVSKTDLLEESFSSLLDVSESQVLGDSPFAASSSGTTSSAPPPIPNEPADIFDFDVSSSDLATAAPIFSEAPPPLPTSAFTPLAGESAAINRAIETGAKPSNAAAVAHMSPILQQQVQETLEKVAWEAFSDLSETIVKQVIERVERIAWEVIPQMAETLVREEIRKMKGEED